MYNFTNERDALVTSRHVTAHWRVPVLFMYSVYRSALESSAAAITRADRSSEYPRYYNKLQLSHALCIGCLVSAGRHTVHTHTYTYTHTHTQTHTHTHTRAPHARTRASRVACARLFPLVFVVAHQSGNGQVNDIIMRSSSFYIILLGNGTILQLYIYSKI